jgi:hypothetical protein
MPFEIAFVVILGVIIVVGISALGKPLADAQAEKVRFRFRSLGSEAQEALTKKSDYLESEIMDLKQRVKALEEIAEFNKQQAQDGGTIKTSSKQHAD